LTELHPADIGFLIFILLFHSEKRPCPVWVNRYGPFETDGNILNKKPSSSPNALFFQAE